MEEKFDYDYKLQDVYYPCIYFLIKKDKVVYVGQTEFGLKRILSHIPEKDFDTIKTIKCVKENLNQMEIAYIVKYQPIYNKYLSNATSITRIKQLLIEKGFRIRKNTIKRWVIDNVETHYVFCGEIYVSNLDKEFTLNGLIEHSKK